MNTLSVNKFKEMLQLALKMIKEKEQLLSELDAVFGDGDHGTAIVQAMSSVVESLDNGTEFKQMLNDAGFNVMMKTSGSTSTLVGGFLLGMSDNVSGENLNIAQVKSMFNGGLEGVKKQTKAQPGDKTMMDALVPAIESINNNYTEKLDELFLSAANAAKGGADATVDMKANFGRARNYGDKSVGYADPGATSWACMFEAFSKAL